MHCFRGAETLAVAFEYRHRSATKCLRLTTKKACIFGNDQSRAWCYDAPTRADVHYREEYRGARFGLYHLWLLMLPLRLEKMLNRGEMLGQLPPRQLTASASSPSTAARRAIAGRSASGVRRRMAERGHCLRHEASSRHEARLLIWQSQCAST